MSTPTTDNINININTNTTSSTVTSPTSPTTTTTSTMSTTTTSTTTSATSSSTPQIAAANSPIFNTMGGAITVDTSHKTTPSPIHSDNSIVRLIRRKIYQYEVTYSLYMLTPMEKIIFNTFLIGFLSMLILAASLYLPQHIATIASRGWFYLLGDDEEYAAAAVAAAAKASDNFGVADIKNIVEGAVTTARQAAESVVMREL